MSTKKKIILVIGLTIWTIVIFVGGFFSGTEYIKYSIASSLSEAFEESNEIEVASDAVNEENESGLRTDDAVLVPLGKEVKLATLNINVNGSEEVTSLNSSYGSAKPAKAGAKFVIVDMDVENTTNGNSTFYPDDGLRLIDSKGREFNTYDDSIGSIDNYLDVRELAPNVPENGVLVYEVPEDASDFYLFTSNNSTGKIYKLELQTPQIVN